MQTVNNSKENLLHATDLQKIKPESYRMLCRRLRGTLTEVVTQLEQRCSRYNDDTGCKEQYVRMFGDKENCLGAMTKIVALLGKLADIEQTAKPSSTKTHDHGPEEGGIETADIALLKRFLERHAD